MRRMLAALGGTLLLLTTIWSVAAAQEAEDHAAVGTWLMDDGGIAVIHAGGTFSAIDPDGGIAFGAWTPIDDGTVALTFTFQAPPEAGGGPATARAAVDVSDDGMSSMVSATIEVATPDGGSSGQMGPIEIGGTRLIAEAPGEPVGPFPPEMPAE